MTKEAITSKSGGEIQEGLRCVIGLNKMKSFLQEELRSDLRHFLKTDVGSNDRTFKHAKICWQNVTKQRQKIDLGNGGGH